MHFQPLSPSPFPRKQGKGSDLPLPASREGPQGGVNVPHMALRASRCAERVEFITRFSAQQGVGYPVRSVASYFNEVRPAEITVSVISTA